MNTPNKLTIFRIILVPIFVAILLLEQIPYNYLWAFFIFLLASFTDCLDGYIARKYQMITDFGKLMDPLADKVLVTSALVCFVQLGIVGAVPVIIILAREFLVTSLRLIAVQKNKVIAADIWGKAKTVAQMVMICFVLLLQDLVRHQYISNSVYLACFVNILVVIVVALTVISGANYLIKNRDCFSDLK